jgi:hypothetical protein
VLVSESCIRIAVPLDVGHVPTVTVDKRWAVFRLVLGETQTTDVASLQNHGTAG